MEVELNTDRSGFLTIGSQVFTYGDPGPRKIDVDGLSPEERRQFIYNINRGVLKAKDIEGLVPEQPVAAAPQQALAQPAQPLQNAIDKAVEEQYKKLKTLSGKAVASIKKEAVDLGANELQKLKTLELEGKKRKSVLGLIDELLEKHQSTVLANVGGDDVGAMFADDPQGTSTQVSEVVESDMEQVVLNPVEE